jgi:hypothetical protein
MHIWLHVEQGMSISFNLEPSHVVPFYYPTFTFICKLQSLCMYSVVDWACLYHDHICFFLIYMDPMTIADGCDLVIPSGP